MPQNPHKPTTDVIRPKTMEESAPLPTGIDPKLAALPWVREGLSATRGVCDICGPQGKRPLVVSEKLTIQVAVLCPHQEAEQAAKAQAMQANANVAEYHSRYGRYRVPKAFRDVRPSDIDPVREGSKRGLAYVHYYLENWAECEREGRGLIFHGLPEAPKGTTPGQNHTNFKNPGSPGTGKTLCATAIAAELERRGVAVAYVNCREMLEVFRDFKSNGRQTLLSAMRVAQVLVLDELVNEHETAFTTQEIVAVLNHRFEAGLPTIITTNFDSSQIGRHYLAVLTKGDGAHTPDVAQVMVRRLLSRMQPPSFMWVPFDGPDQRLAQRATWGPQL